MSGTLVPPESDIFPNRIRWTVADCDRLLELGCLKGRYELIDGEIISKVGQKPPHSFVLLVIADFLISIFGGRRVRQQLPITIPGENGLYSEPEPDIAVTVEQASSYTARHPLPAELLLAIEVADTSVRLDLGVKARMYARAGLVEYWVVDISNRKVHVHKIPSDVSFADVSTYMSGESITIPGTQGAVLSVDAMLPPLDLLVDDSAT